MRHWSVQNTSGEHPKQIPSGILHNERDGIPPDELLEFEKASHRYDEGESCQDHPREQSLTDGQGLAEYAQFRFAEEQDVFTAVSRLLFISQRGCYACVDRRGRG